MIERKKLNKGKIILLIILGVILVFILRFIYYQYIQVGFYLFKNYGTGIEITEKSVERTGALFSSWLEKKYECSDKNNNVKFTVVFNEMKYGRYELKYDTYKAVARSIDCRKEMEEVVSKYTEYYIIAENGGELSGHDIFILTNNAEDIKAVYNELDGIIQNYRIEYNDYMQYNLIITKDKELFSVFQQADMLGPSKEDAPYKGLLGPEEILPVASDCLAERITALFYGDDNALYDIFKNNGNINDKDYKEPSEFKYIVFCCTSEPNRLLSSESNIKVFGLNPID